MMYDQINFTTKFNNPIMSHIADPNVSHLIALLGNTEDDIVSCKIIISYFAKMKVYISKFLFAQILVQEYGNKYSLLYNFALKSKLFYNDPDLDSDGEPELDEDDSEDDDDDSDDDSDDSDDDWSDNEGSDDGINLDNSTECKKSYKN